MSIQGGRCFFILGAGEVGLPRGLVPVAGGWLTRALSTEWGAPMAFPLGALRLASACAVTLLLPILSDRTRPAERPLCGRPPLTRWGWPPPTRAEGLEHARSAWDWGERAPGAVGSAGPPCLLAVFEMLGVSVTPTSFSAAAAVFPCCTSPTGLLPAVRERTARACLRPFFFAAPSASCWLHSACVCMPQQTLLRALLCAAIDTPHTTPVEFTALHPAAAASAQRAVPPCSRVCSIWLHQQQEHDIACLRCIALCASLLCLDYTCTTRAPCTCPDTHAPRSNKHPRPTSSCMKAFFRVPRCST